MAIELKIPEVGESIAEAFVNEWLKSEGDHVDKDEVVAELETDKISFELPAPVSGTLTKVLKQKGESANVGEVIGQMEEGGAGDESGAKQKKKPTGDAKSPAGTRTKEPGKTEPTEVPVAAGGEQVPGGEKDRPAQPSAQGSGDAEVAGNGSGGRPPEKSADRRGRGGAAGGVAPISARMAAETRGPSSGRAGGGEEEAVPMSPMRRTIARRLVQAQQSAALLTTFNEVDLSAVNELRYTYRDRFEKRYGVRLGFMSFFIKAAVDALKAFPVINAEVRENEILYRNYYDIGVAVSTDKGLVVPVVRGADHLSFAEIEATVSDFGKRARSNQLGLDEIQGGTFTITNGGVFGSLLSTPIVNPPQSGVMGMHTIQDRPVARDGQVVIRPMMYLALTYDHRIVDGREAVTFLSRIREAVEEPARLLMEV